jgi:Ca2+ regulator and membrane fusion protein Fig1
LVVISALWQHGAAVAYASGINGLTARVVLAELGTTAIGFHWAACVSTITVTLGLLVMILSIQLLDRLTDDSEGGITDKGTHPTTAAVTAERGIRQEQVRREDASVEIPVPVSVQARWDDGDE